MYLDKLPKPKKERIAVFPPSILQGLLLMEEILHHLGIPGMYKTLYPGTNYQPQLVSGISEPSTLVGGFNPFEKY